MKGLCNYELLARYGREIKGSKTIATLTEESNLSRSFLSKLINQNLLSVPSKRSLKSLAILSDGKITYNQLLEAAGYLAQDEEKKDEREEDKEISFEKAIFEHFLVKPASVALQMIISILSAFEITENLHIDYSSDCFQISSEMYSGKIICLPAFCYGENEIQGICFAVLRKLIDIITTNTDNIYIYIVSDDIQVLETFKQMIPPIEKKSVYLLYTQDYKNVNIQYDINAQKEVFLVANEKKNRFFNGILAIK